MKTRPLPTYLTAGTRTYHLPFDVKETEQPQITVMVSRREDGTYAAGVAVCNPKDNFCRRTGRKIALQKLWGRPFHGASPQDLVQSICHYLAQINERRFCRGRDEFIPIKHLDRALPGTIKTSFEGGFLTNTKVFRRVRRLSSPFGKGGLFGILGGSR